MRTLEDLQSRMTAAILAGLPSALAADLDAPADPLRRFGIYRNNTRISLTAALAATFPVTVRLVDERFFAYAAAQFIRSEPPREARLAAYGADFPSFLARFPACRGHPYLAEVARLEWAIAEALTIAELEPCPVDALAGMRHDAKPSGLLLQRSLRLLATRWPVLDIWRAHQGQGAALASPLLRKPARLAVHRRGDGIRILALAPASFAFLHALARGRSIDQAVRPTLARNPLFDLTAELVTLFRAGLVVGLRKSSHI